MEIEVRVLAQHDDRAHFDCGNENLNRFFRRFAGQNQFRYHIGINYVAIAEQVICGFVTLATGHMEADELSPNERKGLPAYPLPILRLARLGVAQRFQGEGVGKALLLFVFQLALEQRDRVGCIGVVVDAKPDAIEFYRRYGFTSLFGAVEGGLLVQPSPMPMFLSIRTIAKAARG